MAEEDLMLVSRNAFIGTERRLIGLPELTVSQLGIMV